MVLVGIGKIGIGGFLDLGFSKNNPVKIMAKITIENIPIWTI
tara:strand:- start:94 stop:219 length:126 start_codon:yes stop_codon:yes gene_type:complete